MSLNKPDKDYARLGGASRAATPVELAGTIFYGAAFFPYGREITMKALLCASTVTISLLAGIAPLQAQTSTPVPPKPQSESTGPQDPRSTGSMSQPGENLSERLDRSDGVIHPPTDIAPDMAIRPPDPGTTRVIPPPGTPGR